MDIREFYKSNQNNKQNFNNSSTKHPKQDFGEYQDTINKYKDLSQNQLMSELLKQAGDLKAQGKLDNSTLNMLSNTLSPMLNAEQKQMLNDIIKQLQ